MACGTREVQSGIAARMAAKPGAESRNLQPRIVGGTAANPGAWPWQISMAYNGNHWCGGSIVAPNWIVTASHCFKYSTNPEDYTIVAGKDVCNFD